MTFLHTRTAGKLTSRCTLCGHTIASRDERDVYLGQRGHDPFTCQMRRAENARAALTEAFLADIAEAESTLPKPERTHCPKGTHDWTPENVYTSPRGYDRCRVCNREWQLARKMSSESVRLCCGSVELGVAQGRLRDVSETVQSANSEPPLSAPSTNRKEAVDS